MDVQNTISNDAERKLVVAQIKRAKRVIQAYQKCAEDFEVDISPNVRREHKGDTYRLGLTVESWEKVVQAHDDTVRYLKNGVASLREINHFAAALMLSRGKGSPNWGENLYADIREVRLSLSFAQDILAWYGLTPSVTFQIQDPKEQSEVSSVKVIQLSAAG